MQHCVLMLASRRVTDAQIKTKMIIASVWGFSICFTIARFPQQSHELAEPHDASESSFVLINDAALNLLRVVEWFRCRPIRLAQKFLRKWWNEAAQMNHWVNLTLPLITSGESVFDVSQLEIHYHLISSSTRTPQPVSSYVLKWSVYLMNRIVLISETLPLMPSRKFHQHH